MSQESIGSEMSIDPLPENINIIHFFLWVSHGGNVSAENNLYKMKTNFRSITMYSRPFDTITTDKLEDIIYNKPCELILGSCPYVPIKNPDENNSSYVYLPPLLFHVNEHETNEAIRNYTGLYYMKIAGTPPEIGATPSRLAMNCKIVEGGPTKIVPYEQLIRPFEYNQSENKYTYSTIFRMVENKCKEFNIKPSEALLGLFSCQSLIHEYGNKYIQNIQNLIPRHVYYDKELLTSPIIDNEQQLIYYSGSGISFSNTIIRLNDLPLSWNALAGLKQQGCALNVLSFFGIIPEEKAREQTVCLDLNGTSIFKIIDYLYTYNFNTTGPNSIIGFLVRRLPFNDAINEMITFIKESTINNYCMIFKMYKMEKFNDKDNHRGHTVAFYCKAEPDGSKQLIYIDPQLSEGIVFTREINSLISKKTISESISTILKDKYGYTFQFIDIIYTVQESFEMNRQQYGRSYIFNDESRIIKRTRDITHGGKKIQTHSKKKYLKKSSKLKKSDKKKKHLKKKLSKKKNHIHNKKTKKNRKYKKRYGGNKPPPIDFRALMKEIDDKNPNVPTVLV